jgi:hypothetical protein
VSNFSNTRFILVFYGEPLLEAWKQVAISIEGDPDRTVTEKIPQSLRREALLYGPGCEEVAEGVKSRSAKIA